MEMILMIVAGIIGIMIIVGILKFIWRFIKGFMKTAIYVLPIAFAYLLYTENIVYGIIAGLVAILWYWLIHKIKHWYLGIKYRRMAEKYS